MKWTKLCRIQDVEEGGIKRFSSPLGPVAVVRWNGEFSVFPDRCTHAEYPLSDGTLHEGTLKCRHHGAVFRLGTGEALEMPATEDLELFPVRIQGEDLEADLT